MSVKVYAKLSGLLICTKYCNNSYSDFKICFRTLLKGVLEYAHVQVLNRNCPLQNKKKPLATSVPHACVMAHNDIIINVMALFFLFVHTLVWLAVSSHLSHLDTMNTQEIKKKISLM